MDALPEAIVQYILSAINNARDVAVCNCVSKRWKELTPFLRTLYFPRNAFDALPAAQATPDYIVSTMVSAILSLEHLVVYCPFSASALRHWLSMTSTSLRHLELRVDSLLSNKVANESDDEVENENENENIDHNQSPSSSSSSLFPSKLDYLDLVPYLESLKLWGVLMNKSPKWGGFKNLKVLEIVGAKLKDVALADAIRACPNLTTLSLLGCDGVRFVSFDLPELVHCRLDFYGVGDCSLCLKSPKIQFLEVQGCSWIQINQTHCLKHLSISNSAGRVYKVDVGKLSSLEVLAIRGIQWCWEAISTLLKCATEVKQLVMKIEFTGDYNDFDPFPEIDLGDFFNKHPKLRRFEIHGAMFAALCQKNSLRSVDSSFVIRSLEEVVITVRSPLNAEQKMNTLESLLLCGRNLKKMVIRVLQMKNSHYAADDFFDEICRFRRMNQKIVSIE